MRAFIQPGNVLTLEAPADVLSGEAVVIGNIVGVANHPAATGDLVDLDTVGVFRLRKVAALAIATGDRVYWQSTERAVSKTASGNTLLGVAVAAAANPSDTVDVRLNGSF